MIGHLKGKVYDLGENYLIIDVHDVGYKVTIPQTELLEMREGDEVLLHTYLHVKEDILDLYGSKDEKVIGLFKRLIEVSGIGPKVAMGILSKMIPMDLISAIINSDVTTICSCPGIGKKTAERLILELRDKLMKQGETASTTSIKKAKEDKDVKEECFEALVSLGYKRNESKAIIEKVYKPGMNLEDLIRKALTR